MDEKVAGQAAFFVGAGHLLPIQKVILPKWKVMLAHFIKCCRRERKEQN
jgi:hypothetical protein